MSSALFMLNEQHIPLSVGKVEKMEEHKTGWPFHSQYLKSDLLPFDCVMKIYLYKLFHNTVEAYLHAKPYIWKSILKAASIKRISKSIGNFWLALVLLTDVNDRIKCNLYTSDFTDCKCKCNFFSSHLYLWVGPILL